jgi:hypothetical protein
MARELRKQEVADAVNAYAANNGKTTMLNDAGNIILMPGEVLVGIDGGKLVCNDPVTKEGVADILMDMAEEGHKSPNLPAKAKGGITSRSQAGSQPGSALDAVRECQATEKATYSTGGARKAASAKTNIAALMEAGGSLEIIKREHRTDFIEVVVRASLPVIGMRTKNVDSSISIYKQEYLAKKAWDWIVKILMEEPGIVTGTDDYGMPEFAANATIKVRIADEGKSVLVSLPAKIALWRELAREWQFAGRVCETKAMSRAADMLLRGDFMSKEEKDEEQSEINKVAEGGKA